MRLRGLAVVGCALIAVFSLASAKGDPKRGEYLAKAAGCRGCHTGDDGVPYAGGRALDTPFGTFYGPNITPHPRHGLGQWSESSFQRAMRLGERPDGAHYYPGFPYTSFNAMTNVDISDLWAYLRSLPPASRPNREHDLKAPFSWRSLMSFWKWLFFSPQPFVPDAKASAEVNRGGYLVNVLGHCGECHTPRNLLGGLDRDRWLAGGELPEGRAPNLTPTRLRKWNDAQLRTFLKTGATPEGDPVADTMYEVIRDSTSQLTPQDLEAMIAYLRSLPPLPEEPR